MTHKLVSLLTILLLLCIPATAEEAATTQAGASTASPYPAGSFTPVPEDFLGTWSIRHIVLEGALITEDALTGGGPGSIVISADSLTSYTEDEPVSTFAYTIDGSTLTASDGSVVQMLARNVLYVYSADDTLSVIFVRSSGPVYSPFFGDWQLLMVYNCGEEVNLSEVAAMQIVCRFDAEGFHAIQNGVVMNSMPVTYVGNQCSLDFGDSTITFTIDGAGLIRGIPEGEDGVMLLIPAAE